MHLVCDGCGGHDEHSPSCPNRSLPTGAQLEAELAALSEAAMDADLWCWGPAYDREKAAQVAHRLRVLAQPNRERTNAAWVLLDRLRKAEAQLAEAQAVLRSVRQRVHQAHHEAGEPAQCGQGICRDIAKALDGAASGERRR